MKIVSLLFLSFSLLLTASGNAQQRSIRFPQFTARLDYGRIGIPEGNSFGIPGDELYKSVVDSAQALLKKNNSDTSALFILAIMKSQKIALNAPTEDYLPVTQEAFNHIQKAFDNGLNNLIAKVLRARICSHLKTFYLLDESWKYETNVIRTKRKAAFEKFQALANQYYEELIKLDPGSAWEYKKMIRIEKYPLPVK